MEFRTRLISSLVKVFPDEELSAPTRNSGSALQGETFAFQIAYRSDRILNPVKVALATPITLAVQIRRVELVPVHLVGYDFDSDVLRKTPGLYPDPLLDFDGVLKILPHQWQALWVTVKVPENHPGGQFAIDIDFAYEAADGNCFQLRETFNLGVIPVKLPKQQLIHTEWFHVDCLSHYYQTPVWSERHWQIIARYMRNAVEHGINMILTPLFTPPLDTAVGGERLTTQLVEVQRHDNTYTFGFDRLQRWIDTALAAGIEYFEMSHLFTQWGAAHAPKIVAQTEAKEQLIFGWNTAAAGPEYTAFLNTFLPILTDWLKKQGLAERVYFHVSDEPNLSQLESYAQAAVLVRQHLAEFKIIDALSELEFYRHGLVSGPIPAISAIESFVTAEVTPLWTYYCCGQWNRVTNRFLHFPSSRNRIAGTLFYRYNIVGFLQWGFNFWNSQYSLQNIDPWQVTDCDGAFPAGDAFMVYPAADGNPVDSIHYEVFSEALQDQRALQLLERKMGRAALVEWLDHWQGYPITMSDYPRGEEKVIALREQVNRLISNYFLA